METLELKYIACIIKKAVNILIPGITQHVVNAVHNGPIEDYAPGGICRTPADSAVLRANVEPWA